MRSIIFTASLTFLLAGCGGNANRIVTHPENGVALSLPNAFAVCARVGGQLEATHGDAELYYASDCVAHDWAPSPRGKEQSLSDPSGESKLARSVEVEVSEKPFLLDLLGGEVKTKKIAGIDVDYVVVRKDDSEREAVMVVLNLPYGEQIVRYNANSVGSSDLAWVWNSVEYLLTNSDASRMSK